MGLEFGEEAEHGWGVGKGDRVLSAEYSTGSENRRSPVN